MKEIIHAMNGVFHAGKLAHITNVVFDFIILVVMAHVILLFFIPAENADFSDIGIQKAFEHRLAKGAGAAGDHQRLAAEGGHSVIPPRYF